ncbi:MAG TPA: thiamine diphosphokinase [Fimbriimonadaceae bacterium]
MAKRVLAVLGGRDYPADLLKKWAGSASILVAADSGADTLLGLNFTPDMIVGDFDSCSETARNSGAELYRFEDQNYTDCDKLLKFAEEKELFPLVLAGVEGDRVDHVLSSVYSVSRSSFREQITLALRQGLGWVLGPGEHLMAVPGGRVVSLIPLSETFRVTTEGLKWELTGQTLSRTGMVGTSNQSVRDGFTVSFKEGSLLVTAEILESEIPRW